MTTSESANELDHLVDKLDSLDSKKAWGEIVVHLIKSNISISENTIKLVKSLDDSSVETNRINRTIMYLTIAVGASAIVTIIKDILDMLR